jgi:hypothetical protein
MTQQYLVGELSLILGELQAAATSAVVVRDVALLRQEAETTAPAALGPVVSRAVRLVDRVCCDALTQGESAAFIRDTAIYAELWEFGVCAGLLEEGPTRNEMEL